MYILWLFHNYNIYAMYNHNEVEKKWQNYWLEHKIYAFKDIKSKPKAYILDMFPYPSGQGLHVGHPKGYTATDVYSRYKHLNGYSVLHPIGWDAFGLPAEQYAIKTNNHPESFTLHNIDVFRKQLQSLGFCFDYNKEVNTTDPKFYKWTQWIFAKLFEKGLAEIRDIDVNWCEELKTVLSNEEVLNKDGKMVSERGEHLVVKKPMRQWVLKITDYAEKLLDGLNLVEWPESLKSIQRKWIGKSIGAIIKFKTTCDFDIEVFTTRSDTIYGVSFIAIAPDHNDVNKYISQTYKKECDKYISNAKTKSELQRKSIDKIQTGVFTGNYAINPFTNEQIPIYICDYVLKDYATGSLMGVPAHDERDYNFAKKYKLPIKFIIECKDHDRAYIGDGKHINSKLINGLNILEAQKKINKHLVKNNIGYEKITYKMKDWIFSRQRYWGEPFPIIFDKNNKPHLIDELPVLLPKCKDFKPSADGRSPLANITNWIQYKKNNTTYLRETNTMPNWAGSSWYYLAYILKQPDGNYIDLNSKKAYDLFKRWLPVDFYVGGQEHAVLHLLYSRFWHRFLYDIGVVPTPEPFNKLINQGMILGENGEKMSKSKGNVINPDEIVKTHGADALRLYEMFMGPLTASLPWSDDNLTSIRKWLDRVHNLFVNSKDKFSNQIDTELEYQYHLFIKNITRNIEKYNYNVAISDMMIFINKCYQAKTIKKEYLLNFVIVLSCFAPHLADELYSMLGNKKCIFASANWPSFDENKLLKDKINIPVSINGKHRDTISVSFNANQQEVLNIVLQSPKIQIYTKDKKIKKVIFVMNKIINIIV